MIGSRALVTALLGGTLLGGSLLGGAACNVYRSDVDKLCDAERLSQATLKGSRSQLFSWMERNVASSEAVIMVREIEAKDAHGIASALHDEARKAGLASCTFADQAEIQAKDEDFHGDVANLCAGSALKSDGSIARLEILLVDDAERMREVADWAQTNAKSSDTQSIIAKLVASQPKQRGTILRAEAAKVGVTQCLIASTLDTPPPPPPVPVDLHQVNPSFLVEKVDGPAKNQVMLAQTIVGNDVAAAINTCYANALATTPKLAGKLGLKLSIDATGHISSAVPAPPGKGDKDAPKGPIVQCISTAVMAAALPGPPPDGGKKGAKAEVTLELTPSTSGAGYTAAIDPAWLVKLAGKHK